MTCKRCGSISCTSITSSDKPFWLICGVCDAILVSRVMCVGFCRATCNASGFRLYVEGYEEHLCQKRHDGKSDFVIIKQGDELETAEKLLIAALSDSLVEV